MVFLGGVASPWRERWNRWGWLALGGCLPPEGNINTPFRITSQSNIIQNEERAVTIVDVVILAHHFS